jgi:hypothetical protein
VIVIAKGSITRPDARPTACRHASGATNANTRRSDHTSEFINQ